MTAEVGELLKGMNGGGAGGKASAAVPERHFSPPTLKDAIASAPVGSTLFREWFKSYRDDTGAPVWNKQTEDQYNGWLEVWVIAEFFGLIAQ